MYRTNDMALVSFLRMNGHSVQSVFWSNETCYWTFYPTDALLELADQFTQGGAQVEPRDYNKFFNITKRELYDKRNERAK